MKNIETEIMINASIKKVWEILMDFREYPQWNPFILKIEESSKKDDGLSILVKTGKNKSMEFQPTILKREVEKELRWLGHLYVNGLFDGEHYFLLKSEGDEKTKFTHGENFSGILSSIILKTIREDSIKGFQSMNLALKERAENLNI